MVGILVDTTQRYTKCFFFIDIVLCVFSIRSSRYFPLCIPICSAYHIFIFCICEHLTFICACPTKQHATKHTHTKELIKYLVCKGCLCDFIA